MGVNEFTIYTEEEFQQRFLGLTINGQIQTGGSQYSAEDSIEGVAVDWQGQGAVGPVRNQGVCGTGVLYGTVGALEGLGFISSGRF
jgi:C1A family cysteine protease